MNIFGRFRGSHYQFHPNDYFNQTGWRIVHTQVCSLTESKQLLSPERDC